MFVSLGTNRFTWPSSKAATKALTGADLLLLLSREGQGKGNQGSTLGKPQGQHPHTDSDVGSF